MQLFQSRSTETGCTKYLGLVIFSVKYLGLVVFFFLSYIYTHVSFCQGQADIETQNLKILSCGVGNERFTLEWCSQACVLRLFYKITDYRSVHNKMKHWYFFQHWPVYITVKVTQTSGWSLIRNLFLLKLSLRTLDQLKVLILVLPWIKMRMIKC